MKKQYQGLDSGYESDKKRWFKRLREKDTKSTKKYKKHTCKNKKNKIKRFKT